MRLRPPGKSGRGEWIPATTNLPQNSLNADIITNNIPYYLPSGIIVSGINSWIEKLSPAKQAPADNLPNRSTKTVDRITEIRKLLSIGGKLPKGIGTTKLQLKDELARLDAENDIAKAHIYNAKYEGTVQDEIDLLQLEKDNLEADLVNSTLPYHGRATTKLAGWNYSGKQLQIMHTKYETAIRELKTSISP